MYYEKTLSQVKYDCDQYLRKIEAIENAKKQLNEFKGKPKYNVILLSIESWKKEILEIEKTLIPFLKELILNIENKKYLNKLK